MCTDGHLERHLGLWDGRAGQDAGTSDHFGRPEAPSLTQDWPDGEFDTPSETAAVRVCAHRGNASPCLLSTILQSPMCRAQDPRTTLTMLRFAKAKADRLDT